MKLNKRSPNKLVMATQAPANNFIAIPVLLITDYNQMEKLTVIEIPRHL